MKQQRLREALEAMAATPGLEGCALVEIDAGMVWHHAGQIEGVQTFAEAASDYWRLYKRLAGQFADLGDLRQCQGRGQQQGGAQFVAETGKSGSHNSVFLFGSAGLGGLSRKAADQAISV